MLTVDQRRAAEAIESVAVLAGAGTGKTHMLSARYLYHLTEFGLSPIEIVAVTFTRKAAEELRSRIRQDLSRLLATDAVQQSPDRPSVFSKLYERWPGCDVLADLEAAAVNTFHTVAGQICREQAHLLGLAPNFAIQEEWEAILWQKEQLDQVLDALPVEHYASVPYSTLRPILEQLLTDHYTADQALKLDRQAWESRVRDWRQTALDQLIASPAWTESKQILEGCAGKRGDGAEENRLKILELMEAIEDDRDLDQWSPWAGAINLSTGRGSKKNWDSVETLELAKSAIKTVRDQIKKSLKEGIILCQIGEVDDRFEQKLETVKAAYEFVRSRLDVAKKQARVMDFSDLEWYALKALEIPEVQSYYRRRWQAFLVDEFQDTNPVQSAFLKLLHHDRAKMTIVGDGKQSIYRFRRAEVGLFYAWCDRLAASSGGDRVELSQSFRTHRDLVAACNQLCEPLLAEQHQPLQADRTEPPIERPVTLLELVATEKEQNAEARRRAEARAIGQQLREWVDREVQIFDKAQGRARSLTFRDIAILGRTHKNLGLIAQELTAVGLPVNLCSGDLLDTREAQDGAALLRFLADTQDSVALVTLLRSPWFAVSDRALFAISRQFPAEEPPQERDPARVAPRRPPNWWAALQALMADSAALGRLEATDRAALERAAACLGQWRKGRRTELPSQLLHQADRATGYSAAIANLPDGERRLRDWRDFADWIAQLEQGAGDTFGTVRRLRRIETVRRLNPGEPKTLFARSPLEAGDAIELMTIHRSKGLEWPVVVLPDLNPDRDGGRVGNLLVNSELGVAFRWRDRPSDDWQEPALLQLLRAEDRQAEQAETRRLLYVALTRARDRLLLSANVAFRKTEKPEPSEVAETSDRFRPWDWVRSVAQQRGWPIDVIAMPALDDSDLLPDRSPPEIAPPAPIASLGNLWGVVSSGLDELPVVSLSEYARCPRRFAWRIVDDRPPSGDGPARSRRIGTLVHRAIERRITDPATLATYDATLDAAAIGEALDLANRFWHHPIYADLRDDPTAKQEVPIGFDLPLPDGSYLRLNGVADWVGKWGILDFKTDRDRVPSEHGLQLWAYGRALAADRAALVYLRHPDRPIEWFEAAKLAQLEAQAIAVATQIRAGKFAPKPGNQCRFCPYHDQCDAVPTELVKTIESSA